MLHIHQHDYKEQNMGFRVLLMMQIQKVYTQHGLQLLELWYQTLGTMRFIEIVATYCTVSLKAQVATASSM